ncbi:MAG: hypothetical protein HZB16_07080 [Armatimonadetes bacterium]|nr:hypothetical protein [Armatimonadota bacterium]
MAGGEGIAAKANPADKAAWLAGAMERLDARLDEATRRRVRQGCACCLGGKRLETSRAIARDHATLDERLAAANEARFVFGHSVTRLDDGQIEVCFFPEGLEQHRCPCLPHAAEPLSLTYCECCAGHLRHHLGTALGCRVDGQVVASALASGGREGCLFRFTVCGHLG